MSVVYNRKEIKNEIQVLYKLEIYFRRRLKKKKLNNSFTCLVDQVNNSTKLLI